MRRRQVALRPWIKSDSEEVRDWWAEGWQAMCISGAPAPAQRLQIGQLSAKLLSITLDDEFGGFVAVARDRPLIAAIALHPQLRGWGYGSEAIARFEQKAHGKPSALAATGSGLTLYFWLRLGYSPALEQPWRPQALLLTRNKG